MTIRYSKKFIWLYRIVPFLAFGLFIVIAPLTLPPEITAGSWIFASFGLPALAMALYYWREQAQEIPRLEITESGVEDRGLGVGFIAWHDVQFIGSWKMKDSGEGVRLVMESGLRSSYLQECSPVRRISNRMSSFLTGTRGLVINTHGYDRSRDEIISVMRHQHALAIDPAED